MDELRLNLTLSQILGKLKQKYGSWLALEHRTEQLGTKIDRRKLRNLAEGKLDEVVSQAQLLVIDTLAREVGESLTERPLFGVREDLFSHIARLPRVVTLVSARHVTLDANTARNMVSDYDMV